MNLETQQRETPVIYTDSEKKYNAAVEKLELELNKLRGVEDDYQKTHRIEFFKPFPHQDKILDYIKKGKKTILLQGGNRIGKCCTINSLASTPEGDIKIGRLYSEGRPFNVYAFDGEKKVVARASAPFKKPGLHECYRIEMADGSFIECADHHRVLTDCGWFFVSSLHAFYASRLRSNSDSGLSVLPSGVVRLSEKAGGSIADYPDYLRLYDEQLQIVPDSGQDAFPLSGGVPAPSGIALHWDDRGNKYTNSPQPIGAHPSILDALNPALGPFVEFLTQIAGTSDGRSVRLFPTFLQLSTVGAYQLQSTSLFSEVDSKYPAKSQSSYSPLSDDNKIVSFYPIGPQEVYDFEVEKHHNYYAGGLVNHNSVLGCCWVGSCCLGIQPWDGGETVFGQNPIKVRILVKDFEKAADTVIVPALKYWLPKGTYKTKKNNVGTEAYWTFPETGSTMEIVTCKQDSESHEGWDGHIVWADESPTKEHYIANKRGLIDHHGIFLFTMTAVSASWVLDDVVRNTNPSFASSTEIPMRANPLLNEDAIDEFASSIDESDYIARIEGGWLNLVGLILKKFDPQIHIVDDFPLDPSWPVVAMIDHHTAKPHAISFFAFDPHDNVYHIDDVWEHGGPDEVANNIIRRKINKEEPWRIEHVFIDPLSKGDTENIRRMGVTIEDSYTRIKKKLAEHSIQLQVASKDKKSGIDNVNDMLMGKNKRARLFFFRNVSNKIKNRLGNVVEGTVWEIQRWVYDEHDQPLKENDHFCENLYRMTLTGVKYTDLRKREHKNNQEYNPLTYGLTA